MLEQFYAYHVITRSNYCIDLKICLVQKVLTKLKTDMVTVQSKYKKSYKWKEIESIYFTAPALSDILNWYSAGSVLIVLNNQTWETSYALDALCCAS